MADPHRPSRNLPVSLVARDPAEARRRADRLLRRPVDPRTRASALRVSGLAAYELGLVDEARKRLDSAVSVAVRAGLPDQAAMARASRLGVAARRGDECGTLPPSPFRVSAFTLLGRGVAACQSGRFADALAAFAAAEPAFRSSSDPRLLPGLLCSQGLALVHTERFGEAEEVLHEGLALAEKYSLRRLGAAITQNLGCLAASRGDTALAMERFDAAAPLLGAGTRHPALVLDRAHALADAGMLREAGVLRRSLGPARGGGADRALTELLSLKLAVGHADTAAAEAAVRRLRHLFGADSSWLRAAEQISRPPGSAPVAPRPAPGRPSRAPSSRTATPHLELAAHVGSPDTTRALGDVAAALRAGNAAAALLWSERSRALTTEAHTCQNREWTALLDRYRRAHAAFAESGSAEDHRELARLEVELAVGQWHPCCRRRPPAPSAPGGELLDRLARGLGSRALVHYPEPDGVPAAITLVDGRARLHELPDARTIGDAVAAFEHLARLHAVTPRPQTARLLAERAAAVDRLLVAPVAAAVGDRDLVVVPGPNTQTLPWGLLPGLRGRPVSVAPSGRAWLR
ncbi:CHAT domain-containing protein, partial [Thermobifida halotolerans]